MPRQAIIYPQIGVAGNGGNSDSYKVSSCAHAAITQDMPRAVGLENTDIGVNRNHSSAEPYWSLLSRRVRGLCYYGARCFKLCARGLVVDPYSL
jgi:hypothetical protein